MGDVDNLSMKRVIVLEICTKNLHYYLSANTSCIYACFMCLQEMDKNISMRQNLSAMQESYINGLHQLTNSTVCSLCLTLFIFTSDFYMT